MGKVTGFLEIEREDRSYQPAADRVRHFKEFVIDPSEADIAKQAARCMDCGIPYCHTGCPVNNQIPDWNDLVYHSDWEEAAQNLHSTNNFPRGHRPHLPRAVRGGVHAEHYRRTGDDQIHRAGHRGPRLRRRLGRAAAVPIGHDRKTRLPSSDRGPAGLAAAQQLGARRPRRACLRETVPNPAGCSATAFPTSRWRNPSSSAVWRRWKPRASRSTATSKSARTPTSATWSAITMLSCWRAAPSVRATLTCPGATSPASTSP